MDSQQFSEWKAFHCKNNSESMVEFHNYFRLCIFVCTETSGWQHPVQSVIKFRQNDFFQRGRWGTLLKITWISLLHTIRYFIPANASSCNIFLSCVYFYLSEVWKEFSCHDVIISDYIEAALRWRRNEHDGISNHQPLDCLVNCLFRRKSKKTSKLRVTSFCVRNSLVTGEFPAQRASNAENVSIWWRHHGVIFEKQIKSHMHLNRFISINISIKINKYGICTF